MVCATSKASDQPAHTRSLIRAFANYADAYDGILEHKPTNLQVLLGLIIDDNKLFRCKGRLQNASLTKGAICPILHTTKESSGHF